MGIVAICLCVVVIVGVIYAIIKIPWKCCGV